MLPHRDSKDVFILGGIDDIQALLDDSMVNRQFIFEIKHHYDHDHRYLHCHDQYHYYYEHHWSSFQWSVIKPKSKKSL